MKRWLLAALIFVSSLAQAQYVTLTGTIQGSNGVAADDYTLAFQPTQYFWVPGTAVVISTTSNCATSVDGSVVGLPNPLQSVVVTASFSGTLPPSNYYVEYTFIQTGGETLPSPEIIVQLTGTGSITVNAPTQGVPAGATGMRVYIGATSGAETLQGSTTGNNSFVQSVPLVSGANPPATNNTLCKQVANDAGWPTGTGYKVSLTDSSGNPVPGYPMVWQLLGPNSTINLSSGLPYYNGIVLYPSPILASPYNHNPQSISGPLSLSSYNLFNVNRLGVGTANPAWSVDVENGFINTSNGYLFNGGAGTNGQCLVSNGTAFIPNSCGTLPTLYYQRMQNNGTLQAQEAYLNFSSNFSLSDNPGSTRTEADLAHTGVTAGTYTNATVQVDAYGRLQAASSGAAQLQTRLAIVNSGICTTANTAYASCGPMTITWSGGGFADANYVFTCTSAVPNSTSGGSTIGVLNVYLGTKTATTTTFYIQNGAATGAGANTVGEIDCTAIHP